MLTMNLIQRPFDYYAPYKGSWYFFMFWRYSKPFGTINITQYDGAGPICLWRVAIKTHNKYDYDYRGADYDDDKPYTGS